MSWPPPTVANPIARPTTFVVRHATTIDYGCDINASYIHAHVRPRDTATQQVLSSTVTLTPRPETAIADVDVFGNHLDQWHVIGTHRHVDIFAESRIARWVNPIPGVDIAPGADPGADFDVPITGNRAGGVDGGLADGIDPSGPIWWLGDSPLVARSNALRALAEPHFARATTPRSVVSALRSLTDAVFNGFVFDPTATTVATAIEEVLASRRGVCQDLAHVMVGAVRSIGLPARYVSGYLETDPPPGSAKLIGADASHAWCSVLVDAIGWVDADPTNNVLNPERHLTVAWGRDYSDVAPTRGVIVGPPTSQSTLVSVDVTRANEAVDS
jgi:transglutaminase-like putative cysteine protease